MSALTFSLAGAATAALLLLIAAAVYKRKNALTVKRDLTQGSEAQTLIRFSLPAIAGALFQQLYSAADAVIVGRYIHKNALAAVGIAGQIFNLTINFVMGLTLGASILIAQYCGAKRFDKLQQTVATSYIAMAAGSLLLAVIGVAGAQTLITWLQTPPEAAKEAQIYMQIVFGGIVFLFLFNTAASILRGAGDSITPLIFLIIASALNILLDILLIVIIPLGVAGAASATVLAQAISCILCFAFLKRQNNKALRFSLNAALFSLKQLKRSLVLGLPVAIQRIAQSAGLLFLSRLINSFGAAAAAVAAISKNIEALLLIVPQNVGSSIAAFAGQNFGANKPKRIEKGLNAAIWLLLASAFLLLPPLILGRSAIYGLFVSRHESKIIESGGLYLLFLAPSFIIAAFTWPFHGMLRGLGQGFAPLAASLSGMWLIRLPLAYLLAKTALGFYAIPLSASAGGLANAILTLLYWQLYGKKKLKKKLAL